MRKDSVIWMSLSALLGIEILRVHITPDSLQAINRLNSTYWKGSIENVQDKFGIPFRYNDLQNLLVGHVNFPKSSKFKLYTEKNQYLLVSKSKKSPLHIKLWVDHRCLPNRYVLKAENSRLIQAEYQEFKKHEEHWIPLQLSLFLSSVDEQMRATFKYSKVMTNTPKKTKFSIPDSYAPMD